jgi:hypothetical protein
MDSNIIKAMILSGIAVIIGLCNYEAGNLENDTEEITLLKLFTNVRMFWISGGPS